MSFDYDRLRVDVAERLIEKFGKDAQMYVNVAGTGAPYDSQLDNETASPIRVVQTGFKKDNNQGTLVEKNDVMFLVSTKGVTVDPELANRIEVGGATYLAVRIDPLKPGNVTMLWKLHARK